MISCPKSCECLNLAKLYVCERLNAKLSSCESVKGKSRLAHISMHFAILLETMRMLEFERKINFSNRLNRNLLILIRRGES